jgi:RelA/SpoT family (p)ppGpp synthetase
MTDKSVISISSLLKKANYLSRSDKSDLKKAYHFCYTAHTGQFRRTGEPYVSHPLAVAEICAGWQLDAEALIAALLHDTVEDTNTSLKQISNKFGGVVTELVDGLSKIDRLVFKDYEEAAAANFRKMLLATAADVRVILIKLADRLHNMRTLDALSKNQKKRIAKETIEVFAPIAYRLGFNELFRQLEDLCFSNLFPYRYETLHRAIQTARGNRKEIVHELEKRIQKKLPSFGIKGRVFGREKSLYSIYLKMKEKNLSFAEVLDIYGFRIVVRTFPECYIALGAIHAIFKPLPGRFKDYIALPKSNGYQSIHTVVIGPYGAPLELQIRTEKMHQLAEAGIASHWLYKEHSKEITPLQQKAHEWMQSLLTFQKQSSEASEFLANLKIDLFPDMVYVFTPQGEVRELQRGSTPVDFAYCVHSDIGNRCSGASINGEQKALDTELKNGDVVIISQSKRASPHPGWLGFVRTPKARAAIRHTLKNVTKEKALAFGYRLLDQALRSIGCLGMNDPQLNWKQLFKETRSNDKDSLLEAIGLGRTLAHVAARRLVAHSAAFNKSSLSPNAREALRVSIDHLTQSPDAITVNGSEGTTVQYANCCHAIAGDFAFGQMLGGAGLSIHRKACKTAARQKQKDPSRWTDVIWGEPIYRLFVTHLRLEVEDTPGTLAIIASAITSAEGNIVDISVLPNQGSNLTILKTSIEVKNRQHLANILRHLRRTEKMYKAIRT